MNSLLLFIVSFSKYRCYTSPIITSRCARHALACGCLTFFFGIAGEQAVALHANDLFLDGEGILICQYGDIAIAAIDFLKDFVKKKDMGLKLKLPPSKVRVLATFLLLLCRK
jgi:hypothetical protein